MKIHSPLLAASLLLSTIPAMAGPLYKVIGADGKVSYTDQAPALAAGKVRVFQGGITRPADGRDLASQHGVGSVRQDAAVQDAHIKPEYASYMPALRVALGNSALAHEAMQLCMQAAPVSTDRYERALGSWKIRNGAALARVEDILNSAMTRARRTGFKQGFFDRTRQALRPVREGTPGRRLGWCDIMAGEIENGRIDLAEKTVIVATTSPTASASDSAR